MLPLTKVGDDGYDADLCIPFPDDGDTWLGIFGKAAAYIPDRLRFVQDPVTRRWRVDQTAMLSSMASAFDRVGETSMVRCGSFFDVMSSCFIHPSIPERSKPFSGASSRRA